MYSAKSDPWLMPRCRSMQPPEDKNTPAELKKHVGSHGWCQRERFTLLASLLVVTSYSVQKELRKATPICLIMFDSSDPWLIPRCRSMQPPWGQRERFALLAYLADASLLVVASYSAQKEQRKALCFCLSAR